MSRPSSSVPRRWPGLPNGSRRFSMLVVYGSSGTIHGASSADAMIANKLHCKLLRVNLAEINVVQDKNGRMSYDALTEKNPRIRKPSNHKSNSELQFTGIDTLNLTLGKATFLRLGTTNKTDEMKMNVNHQVFNNVKTEADLSTAVALALLRSGANLMPNGQGGANWLQLLAPPKK